MKQDTLREPKRSLLQRLKVILSARNTGSNATIKKYQKTIHDRRISSQING